VESMQTSHHDCVRKMSREDDENKEKQWRYTTPSYHTGT